MRAKFQNPTTNFQFFHPPISHSAGGRGGGLDFFFDWNVILSVTQDHMQKFEILRPIFNFFTPQYLIVRGVGGGLDFFSDWNVILWVTQDHMQKF